MVMTVPTVGFEELEGTLPKKKAYSVVAAMSENQARYALWAMLVVLFGDDASARTNARSVYEHCHMDSSNLAMQEALCILADMVIGSAPAGQLAIKACESTIERMRMEKRDAMP